jgi:hypothetical protein
MDPGDLTEIERRETSQNGEDGILEFLCRGIEIPTLSVVELGCGDGRTNCTRALVRREDLVEALWVDMGPDRCRKARRQTQKDGTADRVKVLERELTATNARQILPLLPTLRPDVLAVDLDSIDYYVVRALLWGGLLPSVMCLEYNSILDPHPVTVATRGPPGSKHWAFGCSLMAWQQLLSRWGYRFVTVESNGINAFFVQGAGYDLRLLDGVAWIHWAPNWGLDKRYGGPAERRRLLRESGVQLEVVD